MATPFLRSRLLCFHHARRARGILLDDSRESSDELPLIIGGSRLPLFPQLPIGRRTRTPRPFARTAPSVSHRRTARMRAATSTTKVTAQIPKIISCIIPTIHDII